MSDEAADLRQLLLQEAHVLTARIQAQRDQAERLRLLAERIEEKTAVDEVSLEDLRGQLGTAAQLRIDDFDRRLGGQRLERIAIRLLEDSRGEGAEIHYREWFDLIQGEGYTVGGRDPVATFLTQLHRATRVETVGKRSGRYRLKAVA
ncbi:MAG: hypothetical protein WKF33_01760 [Thermoleophilaceae bacterium]|jgi:hypothetical protein